MNDSKGSNLGAVVEALRGQVEALSARVDELQKELALRPGAAGTMKQSVTCPGCGGRWYFFAANIRDGGKYSGGVLGVSTDRHSQTVEGKFEACICATCGLVEWYIDPRTVRADGSTVRVVDGRTAPPGDPYR